MPIPEGVRGNYEPVLIPSDKPASAESAISISSPAKAAISPAPDKPAAPEIDLGRLRILAAQIIQHRIDALMIALDCCAWPMELKDACQNLQCSDRHVVLRLFATQLKASNETPGYETDGW